MKILLEDEAFYYCHNDKGVLEEMITKYVDDYIWAEKNELVVEITEKVKKKLDISIRDEGIHRLTGKDVKKVGNKKEVSLNCYASSLERDLLNIEEGKNTKIHQLVFNQRDHIRIAQMARGLDKINTMLL